MGALDGIRRLAGLQESGVTTVTVESAGGGKRTYKNVSSLKRRGALGNLYAASNRSGAGYTLEVSGDYAWVYALNGRTVFRGFVNPVTLPPA